MFGLFIELKINDKIDRFVYSAIEIECQVYQVGSYYSFLRIELQ
jgi:hypothetical protein